LRRTGAARKTKTLIEEGRLGEILLVRGALGATLIQHYEKDDWELDADKIPGGPLDNLAVHYVDLMHYLLGPIVKVSGFLTGRLSPSRVPSAATASLLFSNGVIGELSTHQASAYVSELSIYGAKGVLHFRRAGHELWIQEIMDPGEAKASPARMTALEVEGPLPHTGALKEELEDFARCVREGGRPEVGGPEGIAALRVVRAVIESHHSGRIVELSPNI
jgi:predicted dehydrogenase